MTDDELSNKSESDSGSDSEPAERAERWQHYVRNDILEELGRIHLKNGFTVSALLIRDLYPVSSGGLGAEGLPSFMKSLQKFSVSIPKVDPDLNDRVGYPLSADIYTGFIEDLTQFLGAATELKTFEYDADQFQYPGELWSTDPDGQWDEVTFPHLESLRIQRLSIYNDKHTDIRTLPIIQFILRHRTTLKELHPHDCAIDAKSQVPSTWRAVFDVFKEELTNLRQITFLPLPGRDENDTRRFGGYQWYNNVREEYSPYIPNGCEDPAGMGADKESLQALQKELDKRQSTAVAL
ncbi:hypothetical protein D9613_006471 [Agrocybe pediades]|uniref:Uncharacterized protein n=1 Tax=Agrocybe pediades TaxID=84607 RepID=A0A8H4QHF4_9AGAR|nr:hypothetical protein D9613_006471 [Agrocybe pediades]